MVGKRQKIMVKDIHDIKSLHSEIIEPDKNINQVLCRFADRADLGGIFVVDANKKLKGVITKTTLLNFAKLKLGGHLRIGDMKRLIMATNANDIASPWPISVKPEEDVLKALDLMLEYDLIDVPVVDREGRIIGDIQLSEIMLGLVECPIE